MAKRIQKAKTPLQTRELEGTPTQMNLHGDPSRHGKLQKYAVPMDRVVPAVGQARPKPTTPDIKKHTARQPKTQFQADNAREDKRHQHASTNEQTRLRSRGQKPATSKGTCDVPGSQPSKRIGRGPGYDNSKGYAKR